MLSTITNFNAYSIENKILFKVNNEIITNYDLNNQVKYLIALNPEIEKLKYEEILEIAKNNIIREKIKKNEVVKTFKNLDINKDQLNQVIKSIFSRQKVNNSEELSKYLNFINLDFSEIKEKILIEIYWNQLIYDKFSTKVKVDKEKLKKEFINNKKNIKKKYLLSEILFKVDNKSDLTSKILEIENSININGFKNTALTYSISGSSVNGGNLGWLDEDVFIEEIKDELDKIQIGQYTKPILTQSGFLILLIENIEESPEIINIDKELLKLFNIKANQQLDQFSNIYFEKIKKNTSINEL